jgi:hypothetical protein
MTSPSTTASTGLTRGHAQSCGSDVLLLADGLAGDINALVRGARVRCSQLACSADPIGAITALLQRRRQRGEPVRELHLIAHGEGGRIGLGGLWIGQVDLLARLDELAQWQLQRLALWSCGLGRHGQLPQLFAASTGAEVFSSPDLLGHGHWWLSSSSGTGLHASSILADDSLQRWESTLAVDKTRPTGALIRATAPAYAAPSTNPFGITNGGNYITPSFADMYAFRGRDSRP